MQTTTRTEPDLFLCQQTPCAEVDWDDVSREVRAKGRLTLGEVSPDRLLSVACFCQGAGIQVRRVGADVLELLPLTPDLDELAAESWEAGEDAWIEEQAWLAG
jgi:hypothetical protein